MSGDAFLEYESELLAVQWSQLDLECCIFTITQSGRFNCESAIFAYLFASYLRLLGKCGEASINNRSTLFMCALMPRLIVESFKFLRSERRSVVVIGGEDGDHRRLMANIWSFQNKVFYLEKTQL